VGQIQFATNNAVFVWFAGGKLRGKSAAILRSLTRGGATICSGKSALNHYQMTAGLRAFARESMAGIRLRGGGILIRMQ
jgi:hypothetical protein